MKQARNIHSYQPADFKKVEAECPFTPDSVIAFTVFEHCIEQHDWPMRWLDLLRCARV